MAWSVGESRLPGHQSGSLRCGHRRTAGRPHTERARRTAPAGSPCPLRLVCGGTIGRLALHLLLPTYFPACPSDAVEIVALHETVWRLDGLPRHGPGRLAMMGPRSDSECRLQRRGHLRFPHIRPGRDRRARQIPVCASQTTATLSTADPRTRSSLRSSSASLACSRSYSCTRLTTDTRAASRSSSRASWRVELATLRITRSW
jgi:hypothetical protein